MRRDVKDNLPDFYQRIRGLVVMVKDGRAGDRGSKLGMENLNFSFFNLIICFLVYSIRFFKLNDIRIPQIVSSSGETRGHRLKYPGLAPKSLFLSTAVHRTTRTARTRLFKPLLLEGQ